MSDRSTISNSAEAASSERSTRASVPVDASESYRAVCIPAVAGLVIGLVSWVAFFSYLLWIVPLLAIAVSGYGLLQIGRYWPALSGAAAARCGIALGVMFGVGAVAYAGAQRVALETEARRVARMWIELVRAGDLHQAHQLSLDSKLRMDAGANLQRGYEQSDSLTEDFEKFVAMPFVRRMQQLPQSAQVRLLRIGEVVRGQATARVRADLRAETGNPDNDFDIEMVLYRIPDRRTGDFTWRVNARLDTRSPEGGENPVVGPEWGDVGHEP